MNFIQKDRWNSSITIIAKCLFCAAATMFAFSVALTNILLGAALFFAILSGSWWQGVKCCWFEFRLFSLALLAYFTLLVFGLSWSNDLGWGGHVLGRHWFWLLLPAVVALLAKERWRIYFLSSLSFGLTLNLIYCVLQMYGYVEVTTDGSSANDATGHIGHIGFGFVYGIWGSWLLHLGLLWVGRDRFIVWVLAAWSFIMIFSAQGRSGYLIAVVLMLCVFTKWIFDSRNWRIVVPILGAFMLFLIVIVLGPGQERLKGTWFAFTQTQHHDNLDQLDSSDNAILATQDRFNMWKTSLDIWQISPVLGVGTGGLPGAVRAFQTQGLSSSQFIFAHPHNQYLLNLIRWGPLGLFALLLLLTVWMFEGLKTDWQTSVTAPLFTLSALALALHALSSSSMEEHFSAILAVLLLGIALSDESEKDTLIQ